MASHSSSHHPCHLLPSFPQIECIPLTQEMIFIGILLTYCPSSFTFTLVYHKQFFLYACVKYTARTAYIKKTECNIFVTDVTSSSTFFVIAATLVQIRSSNNLHKLFVHASSTLGLFSNVNVQFKGRNYEKLEGWQSSFLYAQIFDSYTYSAYSRFVRFL